MLLSRAGVIATAETGLGNQAPVVSAALLDRNATVGQAFSYTFPDNSFTDPNGDALTYTATLSSGAALPAWLTFTPATRTFSGTPASGDIALITVRVTATDPGSLSVFDDFTISTVAANQAPVVAILLIDQDATVGSGLNYQFAAGSFTDPDNDALTYTATLSSGAALPGWLTFTPATRTFSGTPTTAGLITVRVTATDPGSLSTFDDFTINVAAAAALSRLIITTDIGGDPDDQQSMIRLMLYSNEVNLRGLIAGHGTGTHPATPRPDLIDDIIDDYATVRNNLQLHAPADRPYPQAQTLRDLVKVGSSERDVTLIGAGHDTEASNWIITKVDESSETTYIAIWGGQMDVAQAMFDAQAQKGGANGSAFLAFQAKLRVYAIADQTPGVSAYIRSNWPNLRYVESTQSSTNAMFRGMYQSVQGTIDLVPSGDASLNQTAWLNTNITSGHGALGAGYPDDVVQNPSSTTGVKEGDTPSWFYVLHPGMQDPELPTWGGWGGRFAPRGGGTNHYLDTALEDSPSHFSGSTDSNARRKYAVARWRRDYQIDFSVRADWCVQSFANANHHPVAGVDSDTSRTIVHRTVDSGAAVTLSAIGSTNAAGGTTGLTYRWYQYREIGSYTSAVSISNSTSRDASFTAPTVASTATIHFILEVRTTATPVLVSYRRVVVTVNGQVSSGSITVDNTAFNTSANASLSLGASANYVLALVSLESSTAITGVTVAGQAMIDSGLEAGDATSSRVKAFYLLDANLPSPGTVAVAVSGPTAYYVQVWSLNGAGQGAPTRSAEDASSSAASLALSLANVPVGSFVASGSNFNGASSLTLTGAETTRGSGTGASGGQACVFGDSTGAGATITHTHTRAAGAIRAAALMVELGAA